MRQQAIEAIGAGDGPGGRPLDTAGQGLANPVVAGAGFHGGDRAAGRLQPLPGLLDVVGQVIVGLRQTIFRPTADIEQQPADQEHRHVAHVVTEPGRLALERLRKK